MSNVTIFTESLLTNVTTKIKASTVDSLVTNTMPSSSSSTCPDYMDTNSVIYALVMLTIVSTCVILICTVRRCEKCSKSENNPRKFHCSTCRASFRTVTETELKELKSNDFLDNKNDTETEDADETVLFITPSTSTTEMLR